MRIFFLFFLEKLKVLKPTRAGRSDRHPLCAAARPYLNSRASQAVLGRSGPDKEPETGQNPGTGRCFKITGRPKKNDKFPFFTFFPLSLSRNHVSLTSLAPLLLILLPCFQGLLNAIPKYIIDPKFQIFFSVSSHK